MTDYIFAANERVGYYDGHVVQHCCATELKLGQLLCVGPRLYSIISCIEHRNGRVHVQVSYRPQSIGADIDQLVDDMQNLNIRQ